MREYAPALYKLVDMILSGIVWPIGYLMDHPNLGSAVSYVIAGFVGLLCLAAWFSKSLGCSISWWTVLLPALSCLAACFIGFIFFFAAMGASSIQIPASNANVWDRFEFGANCIFAIVFCGGLGLVSYAIAIGGWYVTVQRMIRGCA